MMFAYNTKANLCASNAHKSAKVEKPSSGNQYCQHEMFHPTLILSAMQCGTDQQA